MCHSGKTLQGRNITVVKGQTVWVKMSRGRFPGGRFIKALDCFYYISTGRLPLARGKLNITPLATSSSGVGGPNVDSLTQVRV